ncbi:MAG: hypothetical protein ACLRJV_21765 [Eubacteriales bacterium]
MLRFLLTNDMGTYVIGKERLRKLAATRWSKAESDWIKIPGIYTAGE